MLGVTPPPPNDHLDAWVSQRQLPATDYRGNRFRTIPTLTICWCALEPVAPVRKPSHTSLIGTVHRMTCGSLPTTQHLHRALSPRQQHGRRLSNCRNDSIGPRVRKVGCPCLVPSRELRGNVSGDCFGERALSGRNSENRQASATIACRLIVTQDEMLAQCIGSQVSPRRYGDGLFRLEDQV